METSRIDADRVTYSGIVSDIEPTFTTLEFGNLRLVRADLSGEVPLSHADLLSPTNQPF